MCNYLNKAVMEVEPKEGRPHSALDEDCLGHCGAHDEFQRRAGLRVERRRQLTIRGRGEEEEGKQAMPCPTARAGSHGSNLSSYVRRLNLFFTVSRIVSSVALHNCGGHEPPIYNSMVLSVA